MNTNNDLNATTNAADTARRAEAEDVLRDVAFVLKMTRRVKQEMLRDVGGRPPVRPTRPGPNRGSSDSRWMILA